MSCVAHNVQEEIQSNSLYWALLTWGQDKSKVFYATVVLLWLLCSKSLDISWYFVFLLIATVLKIEFLRFSGVVFTCGDADNRPLPAVQWHWEHTIIIWKEMCDLNWQCYTSLKMQDCKQVFANVLQCAKNTWSLMPWVFMCMISTEYL